jgi:hypothetical protein
MVPSASVNCEHFSSSIGALLLLIGMLIGIGLLCLQGGGLRDLVWSAVIWFAPAARFRPSSAQAIGCGYSGDRSWRVFIDKFLMGRAPSPAMVAAMHRLAPVGVGDTRMREPSRHEHDQHGGQLNGAVKA